MRKARWCETRAALGLRCRRARSDAALVPRPAPNKDPAEVEDAADEALRRRETKSAAQSRGLRGGDPDRSYQPRSAFISFQVRRRSQTSPVVGLWLLVDPTIMIEPPLGREPVQL